MNAEQEGFDEAINYADNEEASSTKIRTNSDGIPNIALASVRYGVGQWRTAAIATATVIDAGIITSNDKSKFIDKGEVKRAKEELMKALEQEF